MAGAHADYLSPEFIPMAHRGGALLTANLGIENTVRAFSNAVALGYRYLETDVHATSDGTLVAFHRELLDAGAEAAGATAAAACCLPEPCFAGALRRPYHAPDQEVP